MKSAVAAILGVLLLVAVAAPSSAEAARVYVPLSEMAARAAPAPSATPTALPATPAPAPVATATPIVPIATPSLRDQTHIVELKGYGSDSDSDVFAPLEAQLVASGWSRDQFLNFSYRGGFVDPAGRWVSYAYNCPETQAGVVAATVHLEAMLSALLAAHPDWRFVLVGHSFGGLTAWWHVSNAVESSWPLAGVVGAVTVDSPLLGVDSAGTGLMGLANLQSGRGCASGYDQSLQDMAGLASNESTYSARWARDIQTALGRGVRVVTLGNDLDPVYYWTFPGLRSQYLPGLFAHYAIGSGGSSAHSAILRDRASDVAANVAVAAGVAAAAR